MSTLKTVLIGMLILTFNACKPEFKECVSTWNECKKECKANYDNCLEGCKALMPPAGTPFEDKIAWEPFHKCLKECGTCEDKCDAGLRSCLGVEK